MKKRIQYLYEKGGNNAWFQMMLNADNLADLLTELSIHSRCMSRTERAFRNMQEQLKGGSEVRRSV